MSAQNPPGMEPVSLQTPGPAPKLPKLTALASFATDNANVRVHIKRTATDRRQLRLSFIISPGLGAMPRTYATSMRRSGTRTESSGYSIVFTVAPVSGEQGCLERKFFERRS